jgi:hypothetical protein
MRASIPSRSDVTGSASWSQRVLMRGPTPGRPLRRLSNQVDQRRHPKTNATVDPLLDQHFELLTLERSTIDTYVRYADKHIRPFIGRTLVGSLDAGVFDSLHAELRRCRDHCDRSAYVEHRTERAHGVRRALSTSRLRAAQCIDNPADPLCAQRCAQ